MTKLQEPISRYDAKEYLLLDIIDLLNMSAYYTMVGTMAGVDKKNHKKITTKAPKPLPRPEIPGRKKKEKKKFNSTADLARALGGKLRIN